MTSQVGVVMTSYLPPCVCVCGVSSNWVHILRINVEHDVCGRPVATVAQSHLILPVDTLRHFNISLLFGINVIIPGLNDVVKEGPFPQFYLLYCCNVA